MSMNLRQTKKSMRIINILSFQLQNPFQRKAKVKRIQKTTIKVPLVMRIYQKFNQIKLLVAVMIMMEEAALIKETT